MRKSLLFNSIITFLILTPISSVSAQWIESGVVVSAADDWQLNPVFVPDDSSGVIIVWEDRRNSGSIDNQDIYAQRVDADGYVKWALNGVVVCDAANRQARARIASDGNGGAIIIWTDNRSGEYDIYAQRLNRNGIPLWSSDGILVCGVSGDQFGPAIVSDGNGGAIISWKDYRDAHDDYYAQRIDGNGTRMWDSGGVAISTVSVGYLAPICYPEIISDGSGGAIIAWADRRNGPYMVHAQRITVDGDTLWAENGVSVSDVIVRHSAYRIVSDRNNGAILTWVAEREDFRYEHDISTQRIRSNGNVAWYSTGVPVCSSPLWDTRTPDLSSYISGGAIITWVDMRLGGDIYAQKIDSTGTIEWDYNGISICDEIEFQFHPQIISDGEEGAVIAWHDNRDSVHDIYIQRINNEGLPYWEANGRAFYKATEYWSQGSFRIVMPDPENIILSWYENREQESNYDIYLKKINLDGTIPVSTLLQHSSSSIEGCTITLRWELSEEDDDFRFFVLRAENHGEVFLETASQDITADENRYSFRDNTCAYGGSYWYRVEYLEDGKRVVLFETDTIDIPMAEFELGQNFPNPFNPLTTIGYSVKERCRVIIEILDVSGRRVCTLTDGVREGGRYEVRWDGCDEAGREMSSGVYFYQLKAGKTVVSRKMILLK